MHRASIFLALFLGLAAPAKAATLHMSASGSDTAACTASAPCKTFARAYAVAGGGDVVDVGAGVYPAQGHWSDPCCAGTKAVTFRGHQGTVLRGLYTDAANATFDGLDVDAGGGRVLAFQNGGANSVFKNGRVGNVVDEKGLLSTADCSGCVYDNVDFHDVRIATSDVHNECMYSQSPNVTIRNSSFVNCATMDIFFTRGTWWGQPYYGGFTVENNFFGKTFKFGGAVHYYSVVWGDVGGGVVDRATIRGNTFELPLASDSRFTNSVESCNTPGVTLGGIVHQGCGTLPPPLPPPAAQCANGRDDDADGDVDLSDPGCSSSSDNSESPDPPTPPPAAQCANGRDDDADGSVDLSDPGCSSGSDNSESPDPTPPPGGSSGLVGAWGFNESSGARANDSSGLGNHATIVGADRVSTGRFGGALSFSGIGDFASVADDASLDLTTSMTVEAWVNPTSLSGYRTVVFKENMARGREAYALYGTDHSQRPTGEVETDAAYATLSGSRTIAAYTWTHVAITYDGSTLRVYQDGVEVARRALTGSMRASADPLKIGGNSVWSEWFQGRIDEVRIWSTARSATQITADMEDPI